MSSRRYLPLEEYGLVGDGRSAALVGRDGSVDWWCPPRFDAPAVFARLLDDRIGGFCSLAPAGAVHASPLWESSQRYRPGTNVLVTEFRGADARLAVVDAMPWPGPGAGDHGEGGGGHGGRRADVDRGPPTLIRRVEARGGPVQAELRFAPRFDYARGRPEYREAGAGWTAAGGGGERLSLAVDRPAGLEVDGRREEVSGRFRVEPGAPRWVTLRWGERDPGRVRAEAARRALEETAARWRRRAERVPRLSRHPADGPASGDSFAGGARERVVRSALVLDLLTHAPTGAVVESPTTSLPGAGPLRDGRRLPRSPADATAVLAALVGLGRRREARRLARALAERGPGGPPGGNDGDAPGVTLEHLHGHRGERPVRVGGGPGLPPDGPSAPRGAPGDRRSLAARFEAARDLALEGRPGEAAERFEAAAGRAGPTGLLAEAVGPDGPADAAAAEGAEEPDGTGSGRLRGNLPSAATHAALVNAARVVAAAAGGPGEGRRARGARGARDAQNDQ